MADPLSATPLDSKAAAQVINVLDLAPWSDSAAPTVFNNGTAAQAREPAFVFNSDINSKVFLWNGDLTRLKVDAIVNPTNETLSEQSSLNRSIAEVAGPAFVAECRSLRTCRTGEAKTTQGFNLPARMVVHTVGPRYNERYRTAAESALFNCYRGTLQAMKENGLRTVGIPVIHAVRRGYPIDEGAHIALRTVRRFLEQRGEGIDAVVFVVKGADEQAYQKLFPMYFPRSDAEARDTAQRLPEDIGNEDGEPVVAERQIRISDNPTAGLREDEEDDDDRPPLQDEAGADLLSAFAAMDGDHDEERKQRINTTRRADPAADRARQYQMWRDQARTEDLSSVAGLKFIYRAGVDAAGRSIIVFVARNFPAKNIDLKKALMYCINMLDSVVNNDYLIVYFHTLADSSNHPESDFLKELYSIVDDRYRKNLKLVYIVHPTWWTKIATWFFTTFTVSGVKDKVRNVAGLQQLFDCINASELNIPQFILDHDLKINGPLQSPSGAAPDEGGL